MHGNHEKKYGNSRMGVMVLMVVLLAFGGVTAAWGQAGQGLQITQISAPGSTTTFASAVNKSNDVVGNYAISGVTKGFEWTGGTRYKSIVVPRSVNFTRCNGINDAGEIVGDFFGRDNFYHGYTDIGGTITQYDLPGGRGNFSTSLFGVNNNGDFAGAAGGGTLGATNEGFVVIGGTVTTFYGSGTDNTFVNAINDSDVAAGQYFDASGNTYGFTWAAGTLTPISFPGAAQTAALGINNAGEVTGYYIGTNSQVHGFTEIGGVYTTSQLQSVDGINAKGAITGYYTGPNAATYGYLGVPVSFRPTAVNVHNAMDTRIYGVNNAGAMVGYYTTSSNVNHGMMLVGNTVTNIDDPNAANHSTICEGINTTNQVVCSYADSSNLTHGVLWVNGTFTEIPISGAIQVEAFGINDSGDISGAFEDSMGLEHGYLLKGGVNGTLTQLDVPGATYTYGSGVNNSDEVTLQWVDGNANVEASTYNAGTYTTVNAPGGDNVYIHGINTAGSVVYSLGDTNGNFHGAVLTGGKYYLLDAPNSSSTFADGINDSSLIVGVFHNATTGNAEGFKGAK